MGAKLETAESTAIAAAKRAAKAETLLVELTGQLRDEGVSVERVDEKWRITSCRPRYAVREKPKSKDPWDQGETFVCGTCMYYLPKTETFGRCKGRGPTHRGYPAIYARESPCRWHKLVTSKA